jgi:hypothetical protein
MYKGYDNEMFKPARCRSPTEIRSIRILCRNLFTPVLQFILKTVKRVSTTKGADDVICDAVSDCKRRGDYSGHHLFWAGQAIKMNFTQSISGCLANFILLD